jgi:spore germination protein GerM
VSRRVWVLAALSACVAIGVWVLVVSLPRWYAAPQQVAPPAARAADETADRRIRATLYYVSEDGLNLVGVEREVPYAESAVDQAQRLVEAQLQPVKAPLGQAIPDGTTLRSVFVTERGEAYVDVSPEISTRHPGGSIEELFTVYAIVNVITVNLPAITSVQILVDGREVETLAGHVDLRRPLVKNLSLLSRPDAPGKPDAATPPPPATEQPSPRLNP